MYYRQSQSYIMDFINMASKEDSIKTVVIEKKLKLHLWLNLRFDQILCNKVATPWFEPGTTDSLSNNLTTQLRRVAIDKKMWSESKIQVGTGEVSQWVKTDEQILVIRFHPTPHNF